jgi:hypothetical protein
VLNGEECDDGNLVNTDGCTAACTVPVCGDRVRNQATEQCDPGRGDGAFSGNDLIVDQEAGGTDDTGSWLYANHVNESGAPGADLSLAERDDSYLDEPFFCNPANCQIRCSGQAGDHGRTWKNSDWCVFAAEVPGQLNGATEFNNAAFGSYTIYNSSGGYEPELDQSGWAAARAHCDSYGIEADLVVITNTTENGIYLQLADEVPTGWWWTGLNDTGTQAQEPNGVWRWLDGTPTDAFRNWSGPPTVDDRPDDNGSDEDCGGFAASAVSNEDAVGGLEPAGFWNDLVCQSGGVYFGCEFEIPDPAVK